MANGHAHTCALDMHILVHALVEFYNYTWSNIIIICLASVAKSSVDDLLVWSQRGSHMVCSHSPTHREEHWHSTAESFPVGQRKYTQDITKNREAGHTSTACQERFVVSGLLHIEA